VTVVEALLGRDLLYVTGKGGTGKTTVAAALALAAASLDRRALVCEVAGGARPSGTHAIAIEPHEALREWMRSQPGGAVAAAVLGRSAGFRRFVDAAPGAKEMVTIGKAVDLARSSGDLVIVDGPATGHALGMLSTPQTIARVATAGPVGSQARAVHDFLVDPERTGYVGVTLPEEMPVHELLELEAGLQESLGRELELVVVDGVYPDRFSDAEAERLRELAGHGAVRAALSEHRVARAHADLVRRVAGEVAAPVITLPFLFVTELGAVEYERLGRRLLSAPAVRRARVREHGDHALQPPSARLARGIV
jgi:anion-transporting  ArsA/GET3 family ATPase